MVTNAVNWFQVSPRAVSEQWNLCLTALPQEQPGKPHKDRAGKLGPCVRSSRSRDASWNAAVLDLAAAAEPCQRQSPE